MTSEAKTIHATAVMVGDRAVLIRGPSGSGKSRLALALINAGRAMVISKTALIGDDRVFLALKDNGVSVRGAPELAGMIEVRGLGIRTVEAASEAPVAVVVDLADTDAERLPAEKALKTTLLGVELPRIPVGEGFDPAPLVIGFLTTT